MRDGQRALPMGRTFPSRRPPTLRLQAHRFSGWPRRFASRAHDPEASPQVGGTYSEGVTIPATIRNSLGMLAVTV